MTVVTMMRGLTASPASLITMTHGIMMSGAIGTMWMLRRNIIILSGQMGEIALSLPGLRVGWTRMMWWLLQSCMRRAWLHKFRSCRALVVTFGWDPGRRFRIMKIGRMCWTFLVTSTRGPGNILPRSGSILAWPVFISAPEPKPRGFFSESKKKPDQLSCVDNCHLGPGKSFPQYGGALWVQDWLSAIEDNSEALLRASGAGLHNSTFTGGVIPGTGVSWPDLQNFVCVDPELSGMLPECGDMCPGRIACQCLETSAGSASRQFLTLAAGDVSFPDDSGTRLSTSALLSTYFTSGDTTRTRLFVSDDMFSCKQLLRRYALLPESSELHMLFKKNVLASLIIIGIYMGSIYCRWRVRLFASDPVWIHLNYMVVLRVVTAIKDHGLCDPLIHCWNDGDIGIDRILEMMTLAGDAPGGYRPLCLPRLSSCLCIVIIQDNSVDAIVCRWLRVVYSVRFCTLVAMLQYKSRLSS